MSEDTVTPPPAPAAPQPPTGAEVKPKRANDSDELTDFQKLGRKSEANSPDDSPLNRGFYQGVDPVYQTRVDPNEE